MSKWCFNYESGEYEDIDKDGYSWTRGEYRREKEEKERHYNNDDSTNY